MGVLSNLEPASVFYYFEEICSIPHTSHHEKALSDYCVQFAKAHGLACRQDEMGNVLIKAPATPGYEKEPGLILQGHLDMVGDKTADCPLDLEKDAIHPVVDGGYVCAEGTTLGGDDGIAVAYALAVLDAKDIPHPALEVVLTVCEEVGLLGASAMELSDLEGRLLLNIDSEEEGVLTAGCAGGRRVECHLPITRAAVTGTAVKADIAGLAGGHSGTEIHKGRANAIALLGRYLTLLSDHGAEYAVLTLSGGTKENVIPKESSVTLVLPAGITEAGKINEDLAASVKKDVFAPMQVPADEGVSYKEIEQATRNVMNYYMGFRRSMAGMARALEKIRFLSGQAGRLHADTLRDLMRCHEAKDVLTICELAIQATMERKESGRCVYRLTDYPEINPEMAKPLLLMRGENGPVYQWGKAPLL